MLRKIPLSCWQNNPLTVSKRGESFVPSRAKSLSLCANYFENIPLCVFLIHESHTQIRALCAQTRTHPSTHTRTHTHTHSQTRIHTHTRSSVAARSLQVLINHPAVIPSWQLKLTSSWMGENKRPSSGPFPDTFIQSRPDCLRQHQQLFRLHLSPFDKACQVIFL